jgi:hypothetical protein
MNSFVLISYLVLYALTFFCFYVPISCGNKETGKLVGLILGVLITLLLIANADFPFIFILPLIFVFQIIFLIYWSLRKLGKQRTGKVLVYVLTTAFILLLMSPWIEDWTYSKKDVRKVLSFHNIDLKDNFKILKNESGGFRDFYETFTIKLSDNDFNRISNMIKTSPHYKGYFKDYSNTPELHYDGNETIDFETDDFVEREYITDDKMNNGTYHFHFQLDKKDKELSYIGSDE